ncbi:patatin family protein [Bacillus mangrovi]|uniref:Patatin family protein n=1 Tax=Metabacillus mangrovi TaxID=1491830 RepID=A0A7X2S453_9BACI|nr:patatin family protein [Metabacillus mangrovi]MTH53165.1 patatin family protein [Metabacillus mangrovi]
MIRGCSSKKGKGTEELDTGLVLEGGGMRGVYTAGVLEYFMEKKLYFPYVVGVSAGACMAASYLSRQMDRNRTVNIDYAGDPKYLSLQNYIKSRQLFGMDYIFDEIPNRLVPFDFEAFSNSTEKLVIGTTDCRTGKPVYFSKPQSIGDLLTVIRASSSLPFIAPMVPYRDMLLMDGGIVDSIPIRKAEADGMQKNVIILTRNEGYRKAPPRGQWMVRRSLRKFPELATAILSRYAMYNETLAYISEQEQKGNLFVIRPEAKLEVGRIERNPVKLDALYRQGIEDAANQYSRLSEWLRS